MDHLFRDSARPACYERLCLPPKSTDNERASEQTGVRVYHFYPLDGAERIVGRIEVPCGDDAAAKELARQFLDHHPHHWGVEVWDGDRLVHKQTRR